MRMVMLQGAGLSALWKPIAIMSAWGLVSFVLALRLFRWR
jgi:hypothetical protein